MPQARFISSSKINSRSCDLSKEKCSVGRIFSFQKKTDAKEIFVSHADGNSNNDGVVVVSKSIEDVTALVK